MTSVTRTLGPLHFEDLDPKRFEDLVRQLAYDFRPWCRLEATGRAGSDDGFDVRGYEIVEASREHEDRGLDDDAGADIVPIVDNSDRLWLIQCKRERRITPAKLAAYLDDISGDEIGRLHGIIFASACDFSKRAHDTFTAKCKEFGINEFYLWGKAALEDKLYQAQNDNLLFAYFGVSLTIRRRSQSSELRALLATKRKVKRYLEPKLGVHILLRNVEANAYPYDSAIPNFNKCPQWALRQYMGMRHRGIRFLSKRYFAYLSDDGSKWDAAMAFNDAFGHGDPWRQETPEGGHHLRSEIFTFWQSLSKQNRAWLDIIGVIPYEDILAIDEIGDEHVGEPHVFISSISFEKGPYAYLFARVDGTDFDRRRKYVQDPDAPDRLQIFPAAMREVAE